MNAAASTKLLAYALLAAGGTVLAIVSGNPDLALLALPFAAVVVVGVASGRPRAKLELVRAPERALVGDDFEVDVSVESSISLDATVAVTTRPSLSKQTPSARKDVALVGNRATPIPLRVRASRWGRYDSLQVDVRASDPLGLFRYWRSEEFPVVLRVYPARDEIHRQLLPRRTRALSGDFVSSEKGEGLEFADIREHVAGDRVRRINWGVSARKGSLHVNEYRPERNADLVIFLDAFSQLDETHGTTLSRTIAAATTIAQLHLKRHDRVGLICFGGMLRWLIPASGARQSYRIIDALLDVAPYPAPAGPQLAMLPREVFPSGAKVLAISPLLDDRVTDAIVSLCREGLDVSILELPVAVPAHDDGELSGFTARLWVLRRRSLAALVESAGAAIVAWPEDAPLSAVIEQVNEWQRVPRRAFA